MLNHFKDMEKWEVPGIRVGIVCAGDEELAPFCLQLIIAK